MRLQTMLWQSPYGLIHRAPVFEMRTSCGSPMGEKWRAIAGYYIPDLRCHRCFPEAAKRNS